MRNVLFDLRYAVRGLFRASAFALVAVSSLAVGIGANTAVFSVFNAVLLRPFPYPEADALAVVYETQPARGMLRYTISPPDFLDWRANARTLEGSAAYREWTPNLTGVADAERLTGLRVSGDFFRVLGVDPLAGRMLAPDDEAAASRVVVVSQSLWSCSAGIAPSWAACSAWTARATSSPASHRRACSSPETTSISGRR